MEKHTDDLRNVNEGDMVEISTTEGHIFTAECTDFCVQNADPRSGEVRETNIWTFSKYGDTLYASFVDGLRSSPDDPDFPIYNEVWDADHEKKLGYIESVKISGQM